MAKGRNESSWDGGACCLYVSKVVLPAVPGLLRLQPSKRASVYGGCGEGDDQRQASKTGAAATAPRMHTVCMPALLVHHGAGAHTWSRLNQVLLHAGAGSQKDPQPLARPSSSMHQ